MVRRVKNNKTFAIVPYTAPKPSPVYVTSATSAVKGLPKKGGRRRKSRRAGRNMGVNLPQYAIARFDPFNPNAYGVKVPDENQTYALAFQGHLSTSIVTDAAFGTGGFFFTPDPNFIGVGPLAITSPGNFTWPLGYLGASTVGNIVAIQSQFAMSRCVAWGVKLSASQSFSNVAGRVHVCLIAEDFSKAGFAGFLPVNVGQMKALPGYNYTTVGELIQNEFLLCGRVEDASAHRYRTTASPWLTGSVPTYPTTTSETSPGWYGILVIVEGASNASAVIDGDIILHYEGIAHTGDTIFQNSPPAPYQPVVMAAVNNISAIVPPARVVDDAGVGEDTFWGAIKNAWGLATKIAQGVGDAIDLAGDFAAMFL